MVMSRQTFSRYALASAVAATVAIGFGVGQPNPKAG